jgi:hypothetical protein
MAEYDPKILQSFADSLYSRAAFVIAVWTFLGFVAGLFLGAVFVQYVVRRPAGGYVLAGLVIGTLFGLALGMERAFHLKLEAQRTLCQLQLEKNTRLVPEVARFLNQTAISQLEAERSTTRA